MLGFSLAWSSICAVPLRSCRERGHFIIRRDELKGSTTANLSLVYADCRINWSKRLNWYMQQEQWTWMPAGTPGFRPFLWHVCHILCVRDFGQAIFIWNAVYTRKTSVFANTVLRSSLCIRFGYAFLLYWYKRTPKTVTNIPIFGEKCVVV